MKRNAPRANAGDVAGYDTRNAHTYYAQHDFGGPATLSTTLIHALSDVTGVDGTNAERSLYDFVDPDALDNLFKPKPDGTPRANGQVSFTIWGYPVTVDSTGRIAITVPTGNQA